MTRTYAWAAVALLVLVAPLLAFPQVVGAENAWLAAGVGAVALAAATAYLTSVGRVATFVGALSTTAVIGWVLSSDQLLSLNHFCGLALGVLAMATIVVWCRTRVTFAVGVMVFLLLGLAVLAVGFGSVGMYGNKVLVGDPAGRPGAMRPLPFPSLHSRTEVNPNGLAAAALLILPLAVAAVGASPTSARLRRALRATAIVVSLCAATVVLLMQSRSAWMATLFVVWLLLRRWVGARAWWLSGAIMFLVLPVALIAFARSHAPVAAAFQSLTVRVEFWKDGFEALRTSPWFGIGIDYFRYSGFSMWEVGPGIYRGAPHAHNIFLQTALDIGLIGLAAYLAVMGFVIRCAIDLANGRDRRSPNHDEWVRYIGVGAALSVVSVHVFGLLDSVSLGAKVGIFQWLASGLVLAAWRLPPK